METSDNLKFIVKPTLRQPDMVCGINGWVDGGDVSTGGVKYLIKQFNAQEFAEMPASRYHIYQMPGVEGARPIIKMEEGLITETNFPRNQFFYARNPSSDHDLILFLGTEPSLNWDEYTDTVVGLARDFGVRRLYTLGGVLDKTPHTRQPRVSCSCTSAAVRTELQDYNVRFSNYGGPATINTMLIHACNKLGVEGVNFSVRVTYYPEFNVAIEYYPKSIKSILMRMKRLMDLSLSFDELDVTIKELDGKFDFMRQQNPQFNTYVEELEKNYTDVPYQEPLDISAEEAVRFAEEFLRDNKGKGMGDRP